MLKVGMWAELGVSGACSPGTGAAEAHIGALQARQKSPVPLVSFGSHHEWGPMQPTLEIQKKTVFSRPITTSLSLEFTYLLEILRVMGYI